MRIRAGARNAATAATSIVLTLGIAAAGGCSRRGGGPRLPEPLKGEAVWFADGMSSEDPSIEGTLAQFRAAAVYLPARRLTEGAGGWSGADLPAPSRPLASVPVVLVVTAAADPLAGADEKRGKAFGAVLAREVTAALARQKSFGNVRGIHLDVPFSSATAAAHAAAIREVRSLLSHRLAQSDAAATAARALPLTISMRAPPPGEKERESVRALVSRTDGVVAFLFGEGNAADPAFVDGLGKPWWAGYDASASAELRRASGEAGPRVTDATLDALTDDPRTELVREVPWKETGSGSLLTLRATARLSVPGATLSPGDSVVFSMPSVADLVSRIRDVGHRKLVRGRVVVFGAGPDAERTFSVAALGDVVAGRPTAPELRAWAAAEGGRLVRVGAENPTPHGSFVSREQNWIEVDVSPARVGDVELGGFDRWEAYDEDGRAVSPGRASRVRLYETFVAPLERFEPARLRVRGKAPAACCRIRSRVVAATGSESVTDWAAAPNAPAVAAAPPTPGAPSGP